jgi:hypothetical protein
MRVPLCIADMYIVLGNNNIQSTESFAALKCFVREWHTLYVIIMCLTIWTPLISGKMEIMKKRTHLCHYGPKEYRLSGASQYPLQPTSILNLWLGRSVFYIWNQLLLSRMIAHQSINNIEKLPFRRMLFHRKHVMRRCSTYPLLCNIIYCNRIRIIVPHPNPLPRCSKPSFILRPQELLVLLYNDTWWLRFCQSPACPKLIFTITAILLKV